MIFIVAPGARAVAATLGAMSVSEKASEHHCSDTSTVTLSTVLEKKMGLWLGIRSRLMCATYSDRPPE